jgi:2-aminoadipate transaminase
MRQTDTIFIEDDPYGELRFMGKQAPSMGTLLQENVLLLGSFSKIFSPSMRLGWVYAPDDIMDKLITAKQGADLHTNFFSQRLLYEYLSATISTRISKPYARCINDRGTVWWMR